MVDLTIESCDNDLATAVFLLMLRSASRVEVEDDRWNESSHTIMLFFIGHEAT